MHDDQNLHRPRRLTSADRPGFPRPVPGDYGLTLEDLDIRYSPGRAGAVLAVLVTLGTALAEALDAFSLLGSVVGFLYGALLGGFGGLGVIVLLYWIDPLIGQAWPTYDRLRRYREAMAEARRAWESEREP